MKNIRLNTSWEDPNNYPDPETAPPQRWAWEFLRRNKEYQASYSKLQQLELQTKEKVELRQKEANIKYAEEKRANPGKLIRRPLIINEPVRKLSEVIKERFYLSVFPINPSEENPPNIEKIFPTNNTTFHLEAEFEFANSEEKDDPKELLDMVRETIPSDILDEENHHYFEEYFGGKIASTKLENLQVDARPSELTFSINLFGNINNQVKEIGAFANKLKKILKDAEVLEKVKFTPPTYLFYLQVYDALALGVSRKEIIFSLKKDKYPEYNKNATDYIYKKIREMEKQINSGYMDIAKLPSNWLIVRPGV